MFNVTFVRRLKSGHFDVNIILTINRQNYVCVLIILRQLLEEQ